MTAGRSRRYESRWLEADGILDQVAIDRAMSGEAERPKLTRLEQIEAIRQLAAAGVGANITGQRLGLGEMNVLRYRRTYGIGHAA